MRKPRLILTFSDLVVIVEGRHNAATEPGMRFLIDELRVPEQTEILARVSLTLDEVLDFIWNIIDAQRSIHADALQCLDGVRPSTRDLGNEIKIFFAERLGEFVNRRCKEATCALVHVFDSIDPWTRPSRRASRVNFHVETALPTCLRALAVP